MSAALANAVVVRRTIAASPEDLFDAWLDPESLAEWMRPGEIQRAEARTEPRVGGSYQVVMYGASGRILHTGVYRVIDRPRKLVFTWRSPFTDETDSLVTVDFRPEGKRTEVIVTHEQLPAAQLASHARGWTSALEHLEHVCTKGGLS